MEQHHLRMSRVDIVEDAPDFAVIPWTKSKMDSGGRPSSSSTVEMILPASAFEKPRLRRKSCRSSSLRATMR